VTDRVLSRQRIEELAWDAAQRASEQETVIASIADGVMVTDADGHIILENDASRRLTGRAQSAVAFDLVAQAEAQNLRNADGTPVPSHDVPLGRAVRGETVTDQVLIVRRVDTGEDRFLICSSAPVRASGDAITGAVAVFRDITEMKQLDQMKDEFISIAAHELRTPLTAIKGYAELLDRRLSAQAGREADRKSLGIIRKQTERLSTLVNEMLDVSRIEGGRLELNSEPFDLSALVGEAVNNLRVSTTTHVLSLAAEPAIAAFGDAARIEQVLINLISNAITYSPEGGEIGVRAWAEGGNALVSVSDQGVGIAPEELPHLFDRFYRAPRAGVMRSGGMGLGLYICQEIIARHRGTIRADSTVGVGSTFTFTLPLSESKVTSSE
jgi:two-component system phosphate regulon sensor histidine kinase PhoR